MSKPATTTALARILRMKAFYQKLGVKVLLMNEQEECEKDYLNAKVQDES